MNARETDAHASQVVNVDDCNRVIVATGSNRTSVHRSVGTSANFESRLCACVTVVARRVDNSFIFDGVFGVDSTQTEVFNQVELLKLELSDREIAPLECISLIASSVGVGCSTNCQGGLARLQLYYIRLRANWHRQDVHDGGWRTKRRTRSLAGQQRARWHHSESGASNFQ
jgi:hypothetical protein